MTHALIVANSLLTVLLAVALAHEIRISRALQRQLARIFTDCCRAHAAHCPCWVAPDRDDNSAGGFEDDLPDPPF